MTEIKRDNLKLFIKQNISNINNFMDDCFVAEHYRMIDNAVTDKSLIEAIDSLLSAINWRYKERPEVRRIYDDNIATIKKWRAEIKAEAETKSDIR